MLPRFYPTELVSTSGVWGVLDLSVWGVELCFHDAVVRERLEVQTYMPGAAGGTFLPQDRLMWL